MNIYGIISLDNHDDFKEYWNSRHPEKRFWGSIRFNLNKEMDLYLELKDELEKILKEADEIYDEIIKTQFTDEEYDKMDKLVLWLRFMADRDEEDLRKSYRFTECPACGEFIKMEQVAPLYFSGRVFEDDTIDPEDPGLTRECNMFCTDFGEWLVNEKTRKLMEESGIIGVKFGEVTILQENCPLFYQVITENSTGEMVYPLIETFEEACQVCRKLENNIPTPDKLFSVPFESRCFFSGDWRNWALKIKENEYSHYEILNTKEKLGFHRRKNYMQIISPRIRRLFLENGIDEFHVTPVQLV